MWFLHCLASAIMSAHRQIRTMQMGLEMWPRITEKGSKCPLGYTVMESKWGGAILMNWMTFRRRIIGLLCCLLLVLKSLFIIGPCFKRCIRGWCTGCFSLNEGDIPPFWSQRWGAIDYSYSSHLPKTSAEDGKWTKVGRPNLTKWNIDSIMDHPNCSFHHQNWKSNLIYACHSCMPFFYSQMMDIASWNPKPNSNNFKIKRKSLIKCMLFDFNLKLSRLSKLLIEMSNWLLGKI